MPAMEGAVDDGDDPVLGVIVEKMIFEDGLAGAGFAEDDAEAALLAVDFEDVKVTLLVGEVPWYFLVFSVERKIGRN